MDDARFDSLAKTLASRSHRRLAARALLGSALGVLAFADAEAGRSGACRPACAECQSCDEGRCRRKKGKKRCKPGACVQAGNGSGCQNNPCKECQNGECVDKANGTACNGPGKCFGGTCNQPPSCTSVGGSCNLLSDSCCSGDCSAPIGGTCQASSIGERCRTESDCGIIAFCNAQFRCQLIFS
jgi:hypothetical protein